MNSAVVKAAAVHEVVGTYFPHHGPSTKHAYSSLLRKLWKGALKRDEAELLTWDWHRWPNENAWHGRWTHLYHQQLCNWITQAPLQPTTKRNYFNVLHVTYDTNQELQAVTQGYISQLNREINRREGAQMKDAKEMENWKTHEELVGIVDTLHKEVKQLLAYKQCRVMTHTEAFGPQQGWQKLFDWLAMTSMVLQPPVRGDWGDVEYAVTDIAEPSRNILLMSNPQQYKLKIVKDKTVEHLGSGLIPLTEEMQYAVTLSNILWPRQFVFCSKSHIGTELGVGNMTSYLRSIKHPETGHCLNQGVQLLRSSYITWAYGLGIDHNTKRHLANCMRHSWQTAEVHYNKVKQRQDNELEEFLNDVLV